MTLDPSALDALSSAPRIGVFSGAGLSAWEPAGIATGDAFHRRLNELCAYRACPYVDGLVDEDVLDAIRASRLNILARLENTRPGAGAGALAAMRVVVPNEAHLLAALHLARGGLHVTVNFDDGVERAYALLSGAARLPAGHGVFQRALGAWTARWPADAAPLTVLSRPGELGRPLNDRPLLVKMHGSLGRYPDGVTLPFPAVTDEPDAWDWGGARRRVVSNLVAEGFVVVTGFSGTDLASRVTVLDRAVNGHLLWVSADVDPSVRELVAALDPSQPVLGEPTEVLRTVVGGPTPPWPRVAPPGRSFDERLDDWAAALPAEVVAEALGWALTDGGRADVGAQILGRLRRPGPARRTGTMTAVRLADALSRRGGPRDRRTARRLLLTSALAPTRSPHRAGSRGYAWTRLWESLYVDRPRLWPPGTVLARALARWAEHAPGRTASVRVATVATGTVLARLEQDLVSGNTPSRDELRRARLAATFAASGRRVLDRWADQPCGRRGALLQERVIELEVLCAALRRSPAPPGSVVRLVRLVKVLEHISDHDSRRDALGTLALAHLLDGDVSAALDAIAESVAVPDGRPGGAVRLAQTLLPHGAPPPTSAAQYLGDNLLDGIRDAPR